MSISAQLDRLTRQANERTAALSGAVALYRRRAAQFDNPADYAREVLKVRLTPQQEQICDAVVNPPYRVLVPSANNQGKTFIGSVLASWFFDRYDPSTTLITAPNYVQVRDLLFRELRTVRSRAGANFGFMPRDTRLETSVTHYVHGFTAATPDGFQGRHDINLMLLFDEATGIHNDFWKRAETMFGGHAGHAWVAFYNPNDPSSPAYTAEESNLWRVIRLNALEHPNVLRELRGLAPLIPSAIRLQRVQDRIQTECLPVLSGDENPITDFEFPEGSGKYYRPQTPDFEAQVLGRWPLLPTQSLFSPALVDQCAASGRTVEPDWQVSIGVDVARFGDDKTAFVVRKGTAVLRIEKAAKRDTIWIAKRAQDLAYEFAHEDAPRAPILIDDTGGYGGGVVDQLRLAGFTGIGINMSSQSPEPLLTLRMRSFLWFRLAQLANLNLLDLSRLTQQELSDLRADLIAPRYRQDEQGRRVLEPKQQTKQRLRRSPDAGDALSLAFYPVGV